MDTELTRVIGAAIERASEHTWRLDRVDVQSGCVLLHLQASGGTFAIEIRRAEAGRKCYRARGGLAYSYRAATTAPATPVLDRTVDALSRVLDAAHYTVPDVAPTDGAHSVTIDETLFVSPSDSAAPSSGFPTPYERDHLERTLDVPANVAAAFRRDGHVLIRGAIDPAVVRAAHAVVVAALQKQWAQHYVPMEQRTDAYSRSFTQITNLGLDDAAIRVFTQARRIAKMAADLMGVRGVRIFCEDWLIKDPGSDITPWHQDLAVMPFDTQASITLWIPFQPVKDGTGLLRFARGSHRFGVQPIETINDTSEAEFGDIIRRHGWAIDISPPVLVGDVSVHDGATIHGGLPNSSDTPRIALALHCFADDAVIKEPTTPAMRNMRETFAAGLDTGAPAATSFWPLIYDAQDRSIGITQRSSPARPLHVQATLLPNGTRPVDVWIHDGRIRFDPIPEAADIGPAGGFLTSGLVDCHAHISWPHTPAMEQQAQTRAFMNATRAQYAALGVLALRDMGSASDHVSALVDEPGLPRVHASGRLVVPYDGFPFTPTTAATLTPTFIERLERGASWIKVFTDWSNDWGGQFHTGFAETNDVTYPLDALRAAVAAAHELGGRVAAHSFTRAGAEVAIRAGVDSLEHGWGLDRGLIEEMAARGIAWIPLVGIASAMWRDAERKQERDNLAWIERSMATLAQLLPYAHGLGVPVLAGTDWFPNLTVAEEIRELTALGLDTNVALGAGAWEARRWLGEPGLEEGAPADIVLYRADPRSHLDTLDAPSLVLAGGSVVATAPPKEHDPHLPFRERVIGKPATPKADA